MSQSLLWVTQKFICRKWKFIRINGRDILNMITEIKVESHLVCVENAHFLFVSFSLFVLV